MNKIIYLTVIFSLIFLSSTAQEKMLGISTGYLSEIETVGFGADLVIELNNKWGVGVNGTFAKNENLTWIIADANVQYSLINDLFVLTGVEYLNSKFVEKQSVGGFVISETEIKDSFIGINIGAGYRYSLKGGVHLFSEVKYVILERGYLHARVGILFNI